MPLLHPQLAVLLVLAASLVLFVTDAMRYDAVAVLVVVLLTTTRCLTPEEAFAGFASPAVVLVASMYVFAAAVSRAGITETLCERLLQGTAHGEARLVLRVMVISALLSSVLSNAAVVATMIPALGAVSRRSKVPISRLLMPLSFASLTGGMLTLIGTSKNVAVNGAIERLGAQPFHLFDFTLYGLVLLVGCCLYFLGPGRALLPVRRTKETLSEHYQVPKFVTEVLVEPTSGLINRTVAETGLSERYGISILGMVRPQGEGTILAPGPYNRIRGEDVLVIQGDPEAILKLRKELDLHERASMQVGEVRLVSSDVQLVESVVPANSSLVGHTLAEVGFREQTGLNVLAVAQHGDVQPTKIAHTRLDVGDTLLVQGHVRDLQRARESRELILLSEMKAPGFGRKAVLTLVLLGLVLVAAGTGLMPISVAALSGALMLVLLRCVRPGEVHRDVNWSVLVLVGGMLALGRAFEKHGLDDRVAEVLLRSIGVLREPRLVLAVLLIVTVLLTQAINHVAAAMIMTPIAISMAAHLSLSDRPFLMAVLTGASFAYMSPVAHQANAMVMGPGDYRYRDFLRTGTPLTLFLGLVAIVLLPVLWPFQP